VPKRFTQTGGGRRGDLRTVKAAGPETGSTTHAQIDTGDYGTLYVEATVSAVGGTPTLLLVVEADDGAGNWTEVGRVGSNGYSVGSSPPATAPAAITGTGVYRGVFIAAQTMRTRSIIGGTGPSVNYTVNVEAQ